MKLLVVKSQAFDRLTQVWNPHEEYASFLCKDDDDIRQKISTNQPYYPDNTRHSFYVFDVVEGSGVEWGIAIQPLNKENTP